jgi:hypothetical protein
MVVAGVESMMRPPVDDSLAHVTFRLCRMMLARKVLWDQDFGFEAPEMARALATTTAVVEEILENLDREGWIVRSHAPAAGGCRLALTERGTAAILGRGAAGEVGGESALAGGVDGDAAGGAGGALGTAAEELLAG